MPKRWIVHPTLSCFFGHSGPLCRLANRQARCDGKQKLLLTSAETPFSGVIIGQDQSPRFRGLLAHTGHALTENRHGLIVGITVTEANGTAEREAALDLVDELTSTHQRQPKTLGTDKGYDSGDFLQALEARGIEPHVPLVKEPCDPDNVVHTQRQPGVQARHRMKERQATVGYQLSQKCRKKVEEVFGWLKETAKLGRSRLVGRWKIRQLLEIGAAAYNLIRLRKLTPLPQQKGQDEQERPRKDAAKSDGSDCRQPSNHPKET